MTLKASLSNTGDVAGLRPGHSVDAHVPPHAIRVLNVVVRRPIPCPSNVLYHFATKDALLEEVLAYISDGWFDEVKPGVDRLHRPTDKIVHVVDRLVNPAQTRTTVPVAPEPQPPAVPSGSRATLGAQLSVDSVIWLGHGHYMDPETDGHVDCIAHFTRPGRVAVHAPSNQDHPDFSRGQDNLQRLRDARDARDRNVEVVILDSGTTRGVPSLNCYVCNGAVIVLVAGMPEDEVALDLIRTEYPTREVVPAPATVIQTAGGGPHCITQQVPSGTFIT